MVAVERPSGWRLMVIGAALMLAACAQSSRPAAEPFLRVQAIQMETDGLRRFERGDYESATRHFEQALQLQQSLDDGDAVDRNHLNLAAAALMRDQARVALVHLQALKGVKETGLQARAWQLQVQAYLALKDSVAAQQVLTPALTACTDSCAQRGSLLLLQARLALATQQATQALSHLQAALPLLQSQAQAVEVANLWRLRAGAHLSLGQSAQALAAAETALNLDRALALPEKIAQDWLLLGDIYQSSAQTNAARAAFVRAQSVAEAAALVKVQALALERTRQLQ